LTVYERSGRLEGVERELNIQTTPRRLQSADEVDMSTSSESGDPQ
jgi:hypothetical protein